MFPAYLRAKNTLFKFTHLNLSSFLINRLSFAALQIDLKPIRNYSIASQSKSTSLHNFSIINNALCISESALLQLSIQSISSRFTALGTKNVSVDDDTFTALAEKSLLNVPEFESFINIIVQGYINVSGKDLTQVLTSWNRKSKNIRDISNILLELLRNNSDAFFTAVPTSLIKYTINGLCFAKRPQEAFALLECFIETSQKHAKQHLAEIMMQPEMEDMCILILVAFTIQEYTTMADILWIRATSWYADSLLPCKLATTFANYFATQPESPTHIIKLDSLYEMWLKNVHNYDAKFYSKLCEAYAKTKKYAVLEKLLQKCPYAEMNARALGMLIQSKLDSVGTRATVQFLAKLFDTLKESGIAYNPRSFMVVSKAVGRTLDAAFIQEFIQLLEKNAKLLIDDNLITSIYDGVKSVNSFNLDIQRKQSTELIRRVCNEGSLKIIVHSIKKRQN